VGLGKKRKIGSKLPDPPGLPAMPMPPPPGMPLPPPPGLPLPPAPSAPAAPVAPMVPPTPAISETAPKVNPLPAIEALPPSKQDVEVADEESKVEEPSYSGLYAKKSGKPLQQVYGHIDRISQGDIGSLLDRYSDRFGHELDRDIIVMRKDAREDKISEIRDSPTVQLLNEEEDDGGIDAETLVELNSQLKTVEDELRKLKPEYQAAKEERNRELLREIRPTLESLMSERKLLKAIIAGEADLDELFTSESEEEDSEEEEYEEEYEEEDSEEEEYEEEDSEEEEYEEDDDVFIEFVSIVDSLLGNHLSEEMIDEFSSSEGFTVYQKVGSNPSGSNEDLRSEFFTVVDTLLGQLPDKAVDKFVKSKEFDVYRTIGAMYS